MLKGKTKVMLFDAKTHEMTDCVEEENLVTNAVTNVLNGALNAIAVCDNSGVGRHYGLEYLFDLPYGMNIARALFGGVLVFSKSIQTNADHCIPTMEEIETFIGCANQGKSILGSSFKGSYNESESVIGDNYITMVWDFTTEQCNGTIASICLTSDCGGNLGYKFDAISSLNDCHIMSYLSSGMWDKSGQMEFNSAYPHNPMFKSSFSNSNPHGFYIYMNNFYYVYRTQVYKYSLDRLINKLGSNILEAFDYGAVSTYDDLTTIENSYTYVMNCIDSDKCYYRANVNISTGQTIDLLRISRSAVTEEVSVPVDNLIENLSQYSYNRVSSINSAALQNMTIYKDKIYFIAGYVNMSDEQATPNKMRLYALSFDGTFTFRDINMSKSFVEFMFGTTRYDSGGGTTTTALSGIGVSFVNLFDTLFMQSVDSNLGYKYYKVDEDLFVSDLPIFASRYAITSYGYDLYKNENWLSEPWVSFKFCANGYVNTVELWQAYLATINNQSSPVTKTADKTMKIVYTLTQS